MIAMSKKHTDIRIEDQTSLTIFMHHNIYEMRAKSPVELRYRATHRQRGG